MSEEREYSEARQRQIRRRRMEERRRRRRKKRIIRDTVLAGMLAVLILIVYGIGRLFSFLLSGNDEEIIVKKPETQTDKVAEVSVDTSALTPEYQEYYKQISALTDEYPDVKGLYENFADYDAELLELVIKSPETAGFVKDYPSKHNISVIPDVSKEYEPGQIPLFIQWDERWGYSTYGDNMMAINGCGPTCLAMVAVGLTGNTNYHPRYVADLSERNGYYSDTGTSWNLMTEGAQEMGLTGYSLNITSDNIKSELNENHPIIASMVPGDFTTVGHFIVITGIDKDGRLIVNDPNSKIRSGKHWDIDVVMSQSKSMWAYTV
ncbi:MAG: C39 family peptidase [Lachnospiraceae bacterium]|nr:C39 family peptidase [Lachnospiraceae bacterium]